MLVRGVVIKFTDGTSCIVESPLGREGGQGRLYNVKYKGRDNRVTDKILKWYKKRPTDKFINNLQINANNERIRNNASFVWPISICNNELGVGYIMDKVGEEYVEFNRFLANRVHFESEEALINAGIHLCVAFKNLHLEGLAYFDLNDGNFFFNPKTGDIKIIDNDNVSAANNNISNIQGKQGYMAPEIVLGGTHDRNSDLFSLALILFRIIFIDHPLYGENMTRIAIFNNDAITFIEGTHPLFIFDENDYSNKATPISSPNAIDRWNEVPDFIRDLFRRAFSIDLMRNPEGRQRRIIEGVWIRELSRWRSILGRCPICKEPIYFVATDNGICRMCKKKYNILWIRKNSMEEIPLNEGRKIYGSDVGINQPGSHFFQVAEIVKEKNGNRLGIRNLSNMDMIVEFENKKANIQDRKVSLLYDNMSICFANVATVRVYSK